MYKKVHTPQLTSLMNFLILHTPMLVNTHVTNTQITRGRGSAYQKTFLLIPRSVTDPQGTVFLTLLQFGMLHLVHFSLTQCRLNASMAWTLPALCDLFLMTLSGT